MAERKVHCPETDSECWCPECSVKICVLRRVRIFEEQRIAEWEAHCRHANREAAAWRAIRELVAEHNALIDANKPGLNDKNGNHITTRIWLRQRGQRARKERQDLISQVLASERPEIVRRLQNAMNAIVAEERRRFFH
jgi:hypothetical protein